MPGERPVRVGDPLRITPDVFNQLLRLLQQRGVVGGGAAKGLDVPIWVKGLNTLTGVTLQRGDVVQLGGNGASGLCFTFDVNSESSVAGFRTEPVARFYNPSTVSGSVHGVILDPIPEGYVGRALVMGVTPIRLRGSKTSRVAARVNGQRGYMQTGSGDDKVLWQEDSDSERWGLVAIGVGGSGLPAQNCIIRISLFGPPSSGTWGLTWVLPTGTVVIDETDIAYDDDAAAILGILEAEALIDTGDFTVSGDATGGILIEAQTDGQFQNMPLELPQLQLQQLGGVIVGGHCSYDRIGRA